jgi:hypothetical protein
MVLLPGWIAIPGRVGPECQPTFYALTQIPGAVPFHCQSGSHRADAIIRFYAGTVPLPDRDISYWLIRDNRVRDWDTPI